MTVLGAILGIKIQVAGVQSAVTSIKGVKSGLDGVQDSMRASARTARLYQEAMGGAMVALGGSLFSQSITAYEAIEKARRSYVAFAGVTKGTELAAALREFSKQAVLADGIIQKVAQTWVGFVGDTGGALALVKSLDRLQSSAGRTNEQITRAAEAIAQIRNTPLFQKDELNRLVENGIPVNLVAKELGVKNLREATGKKTGEEVVGAINRALMKLPQQSLLPTQAWAKTVAQFQRSLAPTGEALGKILIPANDLAQMLTTLFGQFNSIGRGIPGLLIGGALIVKGFTAVWRASVGPIRAFAILARDANIAAASLRRLAVAAPAAAAGSGAAGAAGAGAAGGAASAAALSIWDRIKLIGAKVLPFITGLARYLGPIAIITGLVYAGIKATEWLANVIRPGSVAPGQGIDAWASRTWNGITGGNQPTPKSEPAATRPQRRSSIENFMYDRSAAMMGA